MSVINNKVNLPNINVRIQSGQGEKKATNESKNFENQFLELVEKLENVSAEIDAMKESSSQQTPLTVKNRVNKVGNFINSMAGYVKDISSSTDEEGKSVQPGKNPYNQVSNKKS